MHVTVDNKWFQSALVLSSLPHALSPAQRLVCRRWRALLPRTAGHRWRRSGDGEVCGKHVTHAWTTQLRRRASPR